MAANSSLPKSVETHRSPGHASADDPVILLVFSCVGLLVDVLALLTQGAAHAISLHFALVSGAAPAAALVALWLADRAD